MNSVVEFLIAFYQPTSCWYLTNQVFMLVAL